MAYPFSEGDIWSGLMSRKKRPPYSNLSGNIYVPPGEFVVQSTDRQSNRWRDIEKSPNLRKWGNLGATSQTPTAPFGGGIGKSAYQGVGSKKKGNKLKYIVEALQEMEGAEPPKLSGGKFGRAMPAPLGFSLASMGGRLGEQEAMAKARREEELRRRMKLMGGGY